MGGDVRRRWVDVRSEFVGGDDGRRWVEEVGMSGWVVTL